MKQLELLNVTELKTEDMLSVNGGINWIGGAAALGAACAWVFEKGEELGRAMAS